MIYRNDFERFWAVKSVTPSQPGHTGSLAHSVYCEDSALTVLYSTDCRHLYCATCLLDWWKTCKTPSCYTCHQLCLYPPARDVVHGLLILAHEESDEGNWVAFDDDSPFRPFFPSVNRASTRNDGGHDGEDYEESTQLESVIGVEGALAASSEGNNEKQVVIYEVEDASSA